MQVILHAGDAVVSVRQHTNCTVAAESSDYESCNRPGHGPCRGRSQLSELHCRDSMSGSSAEAAHGCTACACDLDTKEMSLYTLVRSAVRSAGKYWQSVGSKDSHSHGVCRHVRELVLVEERARVRHLAQPRLDGGQALLSHDDSIVARGSESSSATFLTGSVRPHGSALERAALHAMQSSSGMMYVSTDLTRTAAQPS